MKKTSHILFVALLASIIVALPVHCYSSSGPSILIDPGHSIAHQGAVSCSGNGESDYNQALSKQINDALKSVGIRPTITTTGVDRSLAQRSSMSQGSNLMLSVHHDSVQPQFISVQSDKNGKHYCSTKAQGFSIFVSGRDALGV